MRSATVDCADARRPRIWDPYPVFRILLGLHALRADDLAGSVGRLSPTEARLFLQSIADYPDYLQDALIVIAHAEGIATAGSLLDEAIRRYKWRQNGRNFSA